MPKEKQVQQVPEVDEFHGRGGEYIINKAGKRVPINKAEDAPLAQPLQPTEE